MLRRLRNSNEKGFTLIELMIVIAIIGILAAIAVPNFISYRDKAFCSAAESDLQAIAGAIADYFSDPDNVNVSKASLTVNMSGNPVNTWTLTDLGSNQYQIVVTDTSDRCPRFDTISLTM